MSVALDVDQNARPDPQALFEEVEHVRARMDADAAALVARWQDWIDRPEFFESACNLADYIALRRIDLRLLQDDLCTLGLSSLGRLEARVRPNLDAVMAALSALAGCPTPERLPTRAQMFHGRHRLTVHTEAIFGRAAHGAAPRLMVTLGSEAAEDASVIQHLAARGMDIARINCAHDDRAAWEAMASHVRAASTALGRPLRIMADIAGPKCRTGEVRTAKGFERLRPGDSFYLARGAFAPLDRYPAQATCTLGVALTHLTEGAPVWFDDGHAGGTVVRADSAGVEVTIAHAPDKGVKLRADKGLNFPGTPLGVAPLTGKDIEDLGFVCAHADMIGYSFVQSADDVALLQQELDRLVPERARQIGLVAKIETPQAVHELPNIIARGAGRQPFAVMIARGDLGVEIGFSRLAEMQEEILWLCEAAHVPVIWATEVMAHLVKKGIPSRGEMTDAAMSARAECVMLNKGPHIDHALDWLNDLFDRMMAHQDKKTARLRALHSW